MLKISPSAKQIKKYLTTPQTRFQAPEEWVEFAKLTTIRSGGEIIPFNPYPYQIKLVNLMQEQSVCIVKSRQLGISETVCCYMLWRACLNPGYLGVVFSKTQFDTSLLARRMKRMIESVGLQTATENLGDIEILGKGRILFKNSKPDSARGLESVVDVFFDEFAFIDSAKEIFDSVAPAQQMVGSKARMIVVSTPNGKTGTYWELLSSNNGNIDIEALCQEASKGTTKPFQHWIDAGGWAKILIHWREHAIYGANPNFLLEVNIRQKLSWNTIKQEYDLSFQESESNYFTADLVRLNAIGSVEEIYDSNAQYYLGIDTAHMGSDYYVAWLLKEIDDSYHSVKWYRARQKTKDYNIAKTMDLIQKFNPVRIGVESNSGGQIFLEDLIKLNPNREIVGIHTSLESKIKMLDRMILAMERGKFIYPKDSPIYDELLQFVRKGNKLGAAANSHDDCVMAAAITLTVTPLGTPKIEKPFFTQYFPV